MDIHDAHHILKCKDMEYRLRVLVSNCDVYVVNSSYADHKVWVKDDCILLAKKDGIITYTHETTTMLKNGFDEFEYGVFRLVILSFFNGREVRITNFRNWPAWFKIDKGCRLIKQ